MRTRFLSVLFGALFAAIPFTGADAAPSGSKNLCVTGIGLCDHGNRNNNRNSSSAGNNGGDNGGSEGCSGGSESSRKGSNRKGKNGSGS
jgi:hypothetical protein